MNIFISNSYMQTFIGEQIRKKMLDKVEENSKIKEETLGWRFFNHILKEDEIKAEVWRLLNQDIGQLKMSYKENLMKKEKIEAGDWVRVIAGHSYRLIIGDIYKVLDTSCRFIYLHDSMYSWRRDRFEIVISCLLELNL